LLVLALEEALKARVLVAIATDDEEHRLPDDQVREILSRDHNLRIRAASAEAISPATIIGVLTTHPRDRTPLQQKQLAFDVAMLRWHSEANSLKHRGLYVSFAGGGWESPRDVGEEEFLRAMKFVKPLVKVTINQTARLAP
jgi:AbiV family abortive infection protein